MNAKVKSTFVILLILLFSFSACKKTHYTQSDLIGVWALQDRDYEKYYYIKETDKRLFVSEVSLSRAENYTYKYYETMSDFLDDILSFTSADFNEKKQVLNSIEISKYTPLKFTESGMLQEQDSSFHDVYKRIADTPDELPEIKELFDKCAKTEPKSNTENTSEQTTKRNHNGTLFEQIEGKWLAMQSRKYITEDNQPVYYKAANFEISSTGRIAFHTLSNFDLSDKTDQLSSASIQNKGDGIYTVNGTNLDISIIYNSNLDEMTFMVNYEGDWYYMTMSRYGE